MASHTKKTKTIRRNKKLKSGKERKSVNRNKGTTKTREALFGDLKSSSKAS